MYTSQSCGFVIYSCRIFNKALSSINHLDNQKGSLETSTAAERRLSRLVRLLYFYVLDCASPLHAWNFPAKGAGAEQVLNLGLQASRHQNLHVPRDLLM